jgi:hypothetical protein
MAASRSQTLASQPSPASPAPSLPAGLPARIWVVIRPSGETDYLRREPLGGIENWAKGLEATIVEYRFSKITHTAPTKKKKQS